ncbi:unnamed protein product [Cuscuta europaea]|uniref:Uncharacterized protein n=1 Tax=Cuscuta europaea TaxID=41803 RepID=A0A9P1EF83_CUSEU|nr:unnamed protein product [Cuscuta europaea]
MRGIFLNGLKKDIKAELKLYKTKDLAKIMENAQLIENKNEEILFRKNKEEGKRTWKNTASKGSSYQKWEEGIRSSSNPTPTQSSGNKSNDNKSGEIGEGSNSGKIGPSLSQKELVERSKKGLCFKCGDNWNRGHVCQMRNFKMVLIENSEEEAETEEDCSKSEEEEGPHPELKSMQLSVLSKEGIPYMRTFKVMGKLS